MPFLNPFLLFGLAFATVPILLMLMHRRRLVLRWAAYEWISRAVITKRKTIKINEILKLIAKILLLTAIVLAVARPFIRQRGARGNTLVILDTSPSMGALYEGATRLEKAKTLLERYITTAEHPVALYTLAGEFEPVVAAFTMDKRLLKGSLGNVKSGLGNAGARSFFDQLVRLPVLRETKSIVFIGDFQSEAYGNIGDIEKGMQALGHGYPMTWHRIDPRTGLANCAVEALHAPEDGIFLGRPCEITAVIRNASSQPSDRRTVSLVVDGEIRAQLTATLKPGEKREIAFSTSFPQAGWHSIAVSLDHDILHADDTRMAAVNVPGPLSVLAVAPARGEDPFPYDVFLQSVLRGIFSSDALAYQTITPLELVTANLAEIDLLFLVNVALLPERPYQTAVHTFLQRGGGVAAFLPTAAAGAADALNLKTALREAGGAVVAARLPGTYLSFMSHPELKPDNIRFNRCLVFEDEAPEHARLVIEGGVVGICKPMHAGRLAAFGFIPYPGAGSLQYNPNFVQLMLRLVAELRGAETFYEWSGRIDGWAEPHLERSAAYELTNAAGKRWNLAVDGGGDATRLLLPPELEAGFYTILRNGEEWRRFARNIEAGDSDLADVAAAALAPIKPAGLAMTQGTEPAGALARVDLFGWMLGLLLAAIGFEAYAHFFRET